MRICGSSRSMATTLIIIAHSWLIVQQYRQFCLIIIAHSWIIVKRSVALAPGLLHWAVERGRPAVGRRRGEGGLVALERTQHGAGDHAGLAFFTPRITAHMCVPSTTTATPTLPFGI
jgi:hypothetical protein